MQCLEKSLRTRDVEKLETSPMPSNRNLACQTVTIPKVLNRIALTHMQLLLFGKSDQRPSALPLSCWLTALRAAPETSAGGSSLPPLTDILVKSQLLKFSKTSVAPRGLRQVFDQEGLRYKPHPSGCNNLRFV